MHTEKQEIFDKYAQSQNFGDWDHLLNDFECKLMTIDEFQYFMFEACNLVQQEQQKRMVEKKFTIVTQDAVLRKISEEVVSINQVINPKNIIS